MCSRRAGASRGERAHRARPGPVDGARGCAADSLFAAIGGLVRQGAVFNSDTQIREFSS
jgi:hypothetical protein